MTELNNAEDCHPLKAARCERGGPREALEEDKWRPATDCSSRNGTLDIPVTWQHTAGIHTSKNARYVRDGGIESALGRPLLTALCTATTAVKSQLKTKLGRCEVLVTRAGLTAVGFFCCC